MSYDQKNFKGSLFKNESENPKAPQYKGGCKVGEVEYWLSAWVVKSKDGSKTYMDLSFEEKEVQSSEPVDEDEMPF